MSPIQAVGASKVSKHLDVVTLAFVPHKSNNRKSCNVKNKSVKRLLNAFWIRFFYAAACINGAITVAFVRPSVCPSVAYIANNLRTRRLPCSNSEWRFPTLMRLAYLFQGQKVKMSRSPGPLVLTHILRHIFWMRTYRTPLVVVVWRIYRPFPHQFAPNSHAVF